MMYAYASMYISVYVWIWYQDHESFSHQNRQPTKNKMVKHIFWNLAWRTTRFVSGHRSTIQRQVVHSSTGCLLIPNPKYPPLHPMPKFLLCPDLPKGPCSTYTTREDNRWPAQTSLSIGQASSFRGFQSSAMVVVSDSREPTEHIREKMI